MPFLLSLCVCISNESLARVLLGLLSSDRYTVNRIFVVGDLIDFVEENKEKIDCLIVLNQSSLAPIFNRLHERGTLLPAILIEDLREDRDGDRVYGSDIQQNAALTTSPTYFITVPKFDFPLRT